MKPQELELWTREIVNNVLANKPAEDSRVELKAEWPEPEKAANRLAAHANAARLLYGLIAVTPTRRLILSLGTQEVHNMASS